MKHLLLLRHAKSSWGDETLADFDRPLNKRGKRDAPEMGKRLAKRKVHLDQVLCSPAQRTRDTCSAVLAAFPSHNIDHSIDVVYENAIYEASPQTLLSLIRAQSDAGGADKTKSILLIGHNPALEMVANSLSPEPIGHMPTCACVHLQIDTDQWANITEAKAELVLYDFPKKNAY